MAYNFTDPDKARHLPSGIQQALMWIILTVIILLNIKVFLVVSKMKVRRRSTVYGILSLAIADFGLGLVHIMKLSYLIHTNYQIKDEHPICILDGTSTTIFAEVSIVTITILNLDRLFTIWFPIKYDLLATARKMKVIYVAVWIFFTVLAMPQIFTGKGINIVYHVDSFMCYRIFGKEVISDIAGIALFYTVPVIILLFCDLRIFCLARKRSKLLQQCVHSNNTGIRSESQWRKDLGIVRTLAVMTIGD